MRSAVHLPLPCSAQILRPSHGMPLSPVPRFPAVPQAGVPPKEGAKAFLLPLSGRLRLFPVLRPRRPASQAQPAIPFSYPGFPAQFPANLHQQAGAFRAAVPPVFPHFAAVPADFVSLCRALRYGTFFSVPSRQSLRRPGSKYPLPASPAYTGGGISSPTRQPCPARLQRVSAPEDSAQSAGKFLHTKPNRTPCR